MFIYKFCVTLFYTKAGGGGGGGQFPVKTRYICNTNTKVNHQQPSSFWLKLTVRWCAR